MVLYRIFNLTPTGYIIITSDDNAEPVIGYGLDTNFSFEKAPPALLYLLGEYKEEMKGIIKNKLKADDKIAKKWEKYADEDYLSLKSYSVGTPLLLTDWDQDTPYNQFCPNNVLLGCTAVALGQILHYWGCRVFPDGTSASINFYDQNYDWDAMDHHFGDTENAELLYHCGIAIGIDYAAGSSAATIGDVRDAMEDHFGFQISDVLLRSSYESTWADRLKTDIDASRPICYSGVDRTVTPNAGHAWVIDGYNSSDQFHCNWGHDGQGDGWFYLSNLTDGSFTYTSTQFAIFGAEPILDACEGLNGASSVCPNSNEEYSVSVPALASVTWSKSNNNLTQVGGNTGSTYTVATGLSGGTCTITATIKNSQNQTFMQRSKSVNGMGWPTGTWTQNGTSHTLNTVNFVQSGSQVNTTVYYTPASSFSWSLQSGTGITSWSQYCTSVAANLYLTLNSSGNATFVLNTNTSSCGTLNTTYTFALGYMFSFVIAPNPASTEITVMRLDEQQAKGKAVLKPRKEKFKEKGFSPVDLTQEEYTVSLYSEKKGLLKTVKTSDENCKLDLRDLPPGTYFLHIENEYVLYQEQITIEK